ncbi:hypothetical protein CQZ91_16825 [Bacillus cereus]|uniref:DNA primase family protein n=1 Tax=Bacillus cereus TaxID=1396 RepID=UPI000CFD222E|nr:phage/plasmid primase, P4 family [Bacillus cereus]PRC97507.1 hypothetical protein CQZ92_19950 [Bacillus cereus]PRD02774.1 hypothetical protein CQZ91_16825 [Bacillus cereus]
MSENVVKNIDLIKPYLNKEKNVEYIVLKKEEDQKWVHLSAILSQLQEREGESESYNIRELYATCHAATRNETSAKRLFVGCMSANTPFSIKESEVLAENLSGSVGDLTPLEVLKEELIQYEKLSMAFERGFYYNKKNQLVLREQKFVGYLQKRLFIIASRDTSGIETLLVYNKNRGVYVNDMSLLRRVITLFLTEAVYNYWTANLENKIIELLQRNVSCISEHVFDRSHMIFANKALNLKTLEFEDFSANIYSKICSDVEYDEFATCKNFLKFISEISVNDTELQYLLQEIVGYSLCNNTNAQKAFFFYGKGANGKSVLASIISKLLGVENISSSTLSELNTRFGLQPLLNKKLNLSNENEVANGLQTQAFKAIVSGDSVTVDRKHLPATTVELTVKLIFLMNNLPNTADLSNGFFRRVVIVPFNREFSPEEQDCELPKKLETELSGILNWAVKGLKRLICNNYSFTESKEISKIMETYKRQQSPVEQFLSDGMCYKLGARTKKKDILGAYKQWLSAQAMFANGTDSPQVFWKQLDSAIEKQGRFPIYKKVKGYEHLADFDISFKPTIINHIDFEFSG